MSRLVRLSLLAFFAVVACAAPQTKSVAERAHEIEGRVWSPYCPGRLLIDCTTPQARQLRASITARIARGQSQRHVLAWIERDHGAEALAAPRAGGTGLLVWVVPALLFVIGAVVVAGIVRRGTRSRSAAPPIPAPERIARVREEVERDL